MQQEKKRFALLRRRPVGQKAGELRASQGANTNADLALDVPNVLARHRIDAKLIVRSVGDKARLVALIQTQPLAAELADCHRKLEEVGQDLFKIDSSANAFGE